MAETDDPQEKPENSNPGKPGNRSRRRPWQNRSGRAPNPASGPAPETSSPAPPAEMDVSAWKPLPATTGRVKSPASGGQERTPPGGANPPRGADNPNRPRRDRGDGQRRPNPPGQPNQNDRARERPSRPAAQNSGGPASARSGNRAPRPGEGAANGREDGNRSQNQGQARGRGTTRQRMPGQSSGATSPNQRRRTESAQPRQPGRRAPGGQPRSPGTTRPRGDNVFHPPSVPIKARGGIRARTENGEFGKNWWAKRWLLAMERLMDGARLQRGRRYASMGQVLSMNEETGGIVAKVQGSRPQPYRVTIRVSPLSDEQWDMVLDELAGQAIFTAQLLAGEMPADIEEAFSAAGVSLFPARGGDLMTECSCPDWANPCKHIAATHYILGDRFDEDPFLILRMRGRDQESILQGLRQRRAGQEEIPVEEPEPVEKVQPLEQDIARFWEIGPSLENYSVNVQPPQVEYPLLKRLGQPDFARNLPLERELGPAYQAISQAAIFLAFSDISREPPPENGGENA